MTAYCHQEVTDEDGHLDACNEPATTTRTDPEDGHEYPVCEDHCERRLLDPEPPSRPEGAEDMESFLVGLDYLHDETGASRADLVTLANDLALLIVEQGAES